jgi:DNA helicase-2/ATP-dependent DNA helicase PcrA
MSLDLSGLNSEQLAAVTYTEGPLLLLAGAGTGKTRALTYRIAHIVRDLNVAPYQVLAITFTNKAATEMRERLTGLLPAGTRGMWIMTFHAMCARILRQDGQVLGYGRDFTIYDDDDSRRLVKDIVTQLGVDDKRLSLATIRNRISQAKNDLIGAAEYAAETTDNDAEQIAEVYFELERRLALANAMDFDDLLVNAYRLLKGHPDILDAYQERFRYILIDEYQDTNRAQYQITGLLAAKYRNIMVVGDDDQSIYSWRGADIRNILEFEQDYPEAKVLKLEQNYRSTSTILDCANALIAHNQGRKAKRLFSQEQPGKPVMYYLAGDERDEGRWIAAEILRLHRLGHGFGDFAVFYRTNAQSRVLEDMFLRAGVPYRIFGGTRFFDRQEIRDVMAYLKLVVNPADDISAKRVINQPRRGLGKTTIAAIEALAARERSSFFDACERAQDIEEISKATRRKLGEFVQMIKDMRQFTGELRLVVEMIAERSGLLPALLNQNTDEALSRAENIQEFFGVAAEFEGGLQDDWAALPAVEVTSDSDAVTPAAARSGEVYPDKATPNVAGPVEAAPGEADPVEAALGEADPLMTDPTTETTASSELTRFMEWLALRSDLDASEASEHYVTMMTVHSAKGLEFKVVFLAGMEETLFPHKMSVIKPGDIEEERRLAYVAITRARELLYLSSASQRMLFGVLAHNQPSQFLNEIPAELIKQTGLGSHGLSGLGYEKRGSRHGIYGSGRRLDQPYHQSNARVASDQDVGVYGAGHGSNRHGFDSDSSETTDPERNAGQPDAGLKLTCGDMVDHKTFGRGTVIAVQDDKIEVSFEKSTKTRKLVVGLAPLVKIRN